MGARVDVELKGNNVGLELFCILTGGGCRNYSGDNIV